MYLMFFYSFYMFLFSCIMIGVSVVTYYFMEGYLIEWVICGWNSTMVEIFILIDWVACLFISYVLIISFSVVLYSSVYMSKDKSLKRFLYLVIMFIMSMIMMIMSPSLISILFGWDLLGLVSYCLVIYYQGMSSYNSGMVTVLTNRIGDVGVLMCIGLLLMNGSWNWFMMKSDYMVMLMILLASVTKSAQMPFSSWLPMAMAAPTPVSSLVHSSTLVTAGVYLILRFNDYMMVSLSYVLLMMAVSTMLMSGIMAVFECDLKKVIALSTLSQLGLMMMILSLSLKMLGFFHLLTHAIFKSLLFLCAGGVIHGTKDFQDIRMYGNMCGPMPFHSVGVYVSVLALMGMPFLAGFYSKDLIMESLYILEVNMVLVLLIFFSLMFTVIYSLRLCFYLYFGYVKMWFNDMAESSVMNFSMVVLMIMSLGSGSLLSWLFFFDQEIVFLGQFNKVLLVLIFFFSLFGWQVIFWGKFYWLSWEEKGWMEKLMMSMMVFFFSKMWMLNFMHLSLSKVGLLISQSSKEEDFSWVEQVEGDVIFTLKFMLMKLFYMNFKLYKLFMVQGSFFIILFVYLMV